MINGIDISDLMQNFTSQEWEALEPANRTLEKEMCNHANSHNNNAVGRG
jgi:hypothetical protein